MRTTAQYKIPDAGQTNRRERKKEREPQAHDSKLVIQEKEKKTKVILLERVCVSQWLTHTHE